MTATGNRHTSILLRGMLVFVCVLLSFLGTAITVAAQNGTVRMTVYPAIAVADQRSTINISAEIRDRTGKSVPDGTQVVFGSRFGRFRQDVVTTVNGYAVGILVAPGIPGKSTVTASALQYNATGSAEVEFVTSQEQLSNLTEFIEVYAARFMTYSPELQVLEAAAAGRGVRLSYRKTDIEADDLQLDVNRYDVRAKRARLRVGGEWKEFDELAYSLRTRSGVGLTRVLSQGRRYAPNVGTGIRVETFERERLGYVRIESDQLVKLDARPTNPSFEFRDLSNSMTLINSRRAFVLPGRELQFQKADVYVGGNRILRVQLFQINANSTSPVISDQFINVTGNQLAINYPHYLDLRPGQSSVVRFRSGTPYSTGGGVAGGTFLDYEFRWNQGDRSEGSFVMSGLGRSDWSPTFRHFLRPNHNSTLISSLTFPAHRSMYGTVGYDHRLRGYSVGYSGNIGQSLSGARFRNDQHMVTAELDPISIGGPFQMYLGVSHAQDRFTRTGTTRTSSATQVRNRVQMSPISLGRSSTVNASLYVGQQSGHNVLNGLTSGLTTTLSTQLMRATSLVGTYEYRDGGSGGDYLGRHSVSASIYHGLGNTSLSLRGTRSLDVDRLNAYAEGSYRFTRDWRVMMQYSMDRYLSSSYDEWTALVGYRLGFRELGVSYSARTRRFGFELLGFGVN